MRFHPTVNRRLAVALLAFALASAGLWGCGSKKAGPSPAPSVPTTAPATDPAAEPVKPQPSPKLPGAVGIMIDNFSLARPQVGLEKADMVYEMEAEGGITRFLAIFYRESAEKVGPVRSARMGFYEIAVAHGIPYSHAGGNYDVLRELRQPTTRLLNVDEIFGGGAAYWRSDDRVAPHNLYTSTDRIVKLAGDAKFALKPLAFFPDGAAPDGGKPVTAVAFSWGPKTQDVAWTWNGKRFERSQSGAPHTLEGGARIATDNLVLLFTRFSWDQQAQDGEGQFNVTINGSGEGFFYRDGKGFPIRWSKSSREEPYRLTTTSGTSVPFAAGQTWIEVLKSPEHVTQGAPQ